jgi:hypothetical protein
MDSTPTGTNPQPEHYPDPIATASQTREIDERLSRNYGASFRSLPEPSELLKIILECTGLTEEALTRYWWAGREQFRSDRNDILIRLYDHREMWCNKLPVIETPSGGQQQEANARLHEIRAKLKEHKLGIVCYVDGETNSGRDRSLYRLVHLDEVLTSDSGRQQSFTYRGGNSTSKATKEPEPRKPVVSAPAPTCAPMVADEGGQGVLFHTARRYQDPEASA